MVITFLIVLPSQGEHQVLHDEQDPERAGQPGESGDRGIGEHLGGAPPADLVSHIQGQ